MAKEITVLHDRVVEVARHFRNHAARLAYRRGDMPADKAFKNVRVYQGARTADLARARYEEKRRRHAFDHSGDKLPIRETATEALNGHANEPDDLTQVPGIGDKLARTLNAIGFTRFRHIQDADPDDLADRITRYQRANGGSPVAFSAKKVRAWIDHLGGA